MKKHKTLGRRNVVSRMGDAPSMNNHKVKHIQFIFDDGGYHTLSAHNEQWKSAFTELDDLLMCKDLDGFAICITTRLGGRASFATVIS